MIIQSKREAGFIEMVASRLAQQFIKPLFLLSTEKNYAAYIGGLAEILEWAIEFYDQFYDKIICRESSKPESENSYKAVTLDTLIVAFGHEKIKRFYTQNTIHTSYFIEKYSTVEL